MVAYARISVGLTYYGVGRDSVGLSFEPAGHGTGFKNVVLMGDDDGVQPNVYRTVAKTRQ